jgi:hypothetical protein
MPLLDHFHAPLHPHHSWEAFHSRWAIALADALNEVLPKEFFAEPQSHVGACVEIDVAPFEREAPAPPLTLPAAFPDTFQVRVFSTARGGLDLVAAIELVSPGNKDRAEERRAFAIKAASYLSQGSSLIIVDIVTGRQANLHNEMMDLLEAAEAFHLPADTGLYAVAFRPVVRDDKQQIDIWPTTFALGANLPVLPLGLTRGLCVPVDFQATYTETCRRLRLA